MFRANVRSWQWVCDVGSAVSGRPCQPDSEATSRNRSSGSKRARRPTNCLRNTTRSQWRDRSGCQKLFFLYTASDCDTEFGRFRCAGLLFQPSSIDKEASGNRDTSSQNVTKCDADLHKNLYASVMLIAGAAMFQEIGEYTVEDRT